MGRPQTRGQERLLFMISSARSKTSQRGRRLLLRRKLSSGVFKMVSLLRRYLLMVNVSMRPWVGSLASLAGLADNSLPRLPRIIGDMSCSTTLIVKGSLNLLDRPWIAPSGEVENR